MYRPIDWDTFTDDYVPPMETSFKQAYEAGADAIIEGLKKEGIYIKDGEAYCCPCQVCGNNEDCQATENGHLVFIPEGRNNGVSGLS